MIPVRDFGEWYEDVEDGAVVQYVRDNPEPTIPFEELEAEIIEVGHRKDIYR